METLSGIIERVTFFSEQSGWSVLKVSPFHRSGHFGEKGSQQLVTVTVHQAKVFAGATVEFQGEWVEHAQYGQQFKASTFFEKKPASSAALEKYLGSGLIYGVGPKTAKKIVSYFKQDTMDIFEYDMDRLLEVRGIARAKLETIRKSWTEHREIRNVMIFLQTHGISTLFAVKIYKRYGNDAIAIVQDNPYRLSRDIFGIGFLSADRIAACMGISGKNPKRVKAAIQHVLAASRDEGHCYLTFKQVHHSLETLLQESEPFQKLVQECLQELESTGEIKTRVLREQHNGQTEETSCFYSKTLFFDEKYVAEKISLLKKNRPHQDSKRIRNWIAKFNSRQQFPLSQEQVNSVAGVMAEKFSILTGGPGCGKTTTTKAIVQLAMAMGKQVLLAAPTGRAAQRMEEVIGLPAQTIHRLLVWNPAQGGFKKNEQDTLETNFIIIDECSMMDISLTASLLKAVNHQQTQVLFIGDQDQLPSVGAGNVLKDLITSEKVPTFRLTQVFRQAQKSLIVQHAHQINGGEMPQIDSPFRDPSLWANGCDALFIDSEEATMEGVNFLQRAKRILQYRIDQEGQVLVQQEGMATKLLQKVTQDGKRFLCEDISNKEFEAFKEGKQENKIFTIPQKFRHVQMENLLACSSEAEEVKEVLRRIHPYSSLRYGITATDMIVKLYKETLPKYFGKQLEIQILSPMTRGKMGTLALNSKIQEELNPSSPNKKQVSVGQKISGREIESSRKKIITTLKSLTVKLDKLSTLTLQQWNFSSLSQEKKNGLSTIKRKTCWNSTSPMLSPFINLKEVNSVQLSFPSLPNTSSCYFET